jgi:hypothetical protein
MTAEMPSVTHMNRRDILPANAMVGALGTVTSSKTADSFTGAPPGARVPQLNFVYECQVTLAETQEFGATAEGRRRVIPITGGTFSGPRMGGRVLGIGADWNLLRVDGATTVEAEYYLHTDDGVMIRIINAGVGAVESPTATAGEDLFFLFTHPRFQAPPGKYDWMNRSMFVGTLGAKRGDRNAVLIRVFEMV